MLRDRLNIWHVGNWCIHLGQKYVESPFEAPSKDVEVLNYAKPFVEALRHIPGSDVISEPSWELYHIVYPKILMNVWNGQIRLFLEMWKPNA